MLGLNKMEHNVTTILVESFTVAEPFLTVLVEALNDGTHIVNATISAFVLRKIVEVIRLNWFFS